MKAEWTNSDSLATSQTTKAILVIYMPKNCAGCKFRFNICSAVDWEERPSWCPIKPLPEKKPDRAYWHDDEFSEGYRDGWNACLEEIEKNVREAEHD